MLKRFACVILLLMIGSAAVGGAPLHSAEKECEMSAAMDCCALAHAQEETPATFAARLCCALNCQLPAHSSVNIQTRNLASEQARADEMTPALTHVFKEARRRAKHRPPLREASPPVFILHSAFLI